MTIVPVVLVLVLVVLAAANYSSFDRSDEMGGKSSVEGRGDWQVNGIRSDFDCD